jgi:indolepyruvate ferredoxin oxidoreductase beta subunit
VVVNSHPEALMNVMTGRTPAMPVHAIIRELHALSSSVTILDGLRLAHQTGGAKTLNLVMLGALIGSGYLPLQAAGMAGVLAGEFDTDKAAMNMTAFEAGIAAAKA